MKKNLLAFISVMLAGIMVFSLPVVMFAQGEDSGGTDSDIAMQAAAVAGGSFQWNDVRGFAITESDEKINEEFDVTLCQSVKGEAGSEEPTGHIFGTLEAIQWDDTPEPYIRVTEDDFEEYREDENNLTLYAYGEYEREGPGGTEERYAYIEVMITKPNNPPVPLPYIAEDGNWTWFNLTEEDEVTFITEAGENEITLIFDASHSWDPDGEMVTDWKWDLDEDSKFGGAGETGENLTKVLTSGKTYNLGLKVYDERGKESTKSADFTIIIKSPAQKPDLVISEISYKNHQQGKNNYEDGDMINIYPTVKNIGHNDTEQAFFVLIEYSMDGGDTYQTLVQLEVTDPINPSGVYPLDYSWDTDSDPKFTEGQYLIRATADNTDVIPEEAENNNDNTTNYLNLEKSTVIGDPDIYIDGLASDNAEPKVNSVVNITVTIKNDGDGDAKGVDILYSINNEYAYQQSVEVVPANDQATAIFTFTGDSEGTHTLSFQLKDDGTNIGDPETITVTVIRTTPKPDDNPDDTTSDDSSSDSGFIPGFELLTLLGAATVSITLYTKRRKN